MRNQIQRSGKFIHIILVSGCLVCLYLAKLSNYLLFHTLVEMFSVVVACGVFVISWNTRRIMDNNYFLLVGIASLFIGAVDVLHTLAYKGMGIFPEYGSDLPTQLWIIARYLQSISLLAAPYFIGRKLRAGLTVTIFMAVTTLLLAAVFSGYFPACFVDGQGLTPFKKTSEYLICLMLAGSLFLLRRKAGAFEEGLLRLISTGVTCFIASELSFTVYSDVYGISNMVGHFLKFIGFLFVYKALIETGLSKPYDVLFRELKKSEVRYRDLSDRLAHANANLEVANHDLEAFNSTVSHDLRAPLNNIHCCSQLLLDQDHDLSEEENSEYVRHIYSETERMEQIISTLLRLSRLSHQSISRDPADLSGMAREIADLLKKGGPDRQVEFAIEEGLCAEVDERLFRLALDNLLGNAWKYTSRQDEAFIEFGVKDCGETRAYFIRDNGAGFDMSQKERLFTPFQRLHSKDEFDGNGIGLATVQRIIQRHGGRIWAEGEVGRGATFYFTL
ncbi:MAG: MASE3 domain-containing protein [Geobacteraceae bacterium]|nr:MASE3 domain-containing protein [Geobacteraceae bacterium]